MSGIERFYSPPEIGAPGQRVGKRMRRDLLVTGIFVLVMVLVLVIFMVILSEYSGNTRVVETQCNVSGGIEAGAQVLQENYPIGKVIDIQPTHKDGRLAPPFVISLRIDSRWDISEKNTFVIGSAGMLQGNVLKLVLHDEPIAKIEGRFNCAIEKGVMSEITEILVSVKAQVKELEKAMTGGAESIADGRQSTDGIVKNINDTMENINSLVKAVKPAQIQKIIDSAESTADNIHGITATLTKRSREIEKTIKEFSQLSKQLNTLVRDNRPKVDQSLTDTGYILQELANSMTPILNNLDETSRNLKEVSADFRNSPVPTLFRKKPNDPAGDQQ